MSTTNGTRRLLEHIAARSLTTLAIALLVCAVGAATNASAGPPVGSPEWFPLRGEHELGCTQNNPSPAGRDNCSGYHGYAAMDIDATTEDAVYAAGPGTVQRFSSDQGDNCPPSQYTSWSKCPNHARGNDVVIKHTQTDGTVVYSFYEHLSSVDPAIVSGAVKVVDQNTRLGMAGQSGWADPGYVHLHFEVSSTTSFSGGASRFVSLKACSGGVQKTYPGDLNYPSWAAVLRNTVIRSDGTGCAYGQYGGHIVQWSGDRNVPKTSWLVGDDMKRHWIPTAATYNCLAGQHTPLPPLGSDVLNALPDMRGSWATCDPQRFEGSIVRRSDGVSFVILGAARHVVPDYSTDLCSRYVQGRWESYNGLAGATIQSIPAGDQFRCDLAPSILVASDKPDPKPSYAFYGGRRHWIPDAATYWWVTKHGYSRVVQVPHEEILKLADGGTETRRIDVPDNSIIRETTVSFSALSPASWVVKGGLRYRIPDSATDLCAQFVNGLQVALTGLDSAVVAASYPDSRQTYECGLQNTVLRGMDKPDPKPSYAYYSGSIHSIPDGWTYSYLLKHGFKKADVATDAAIRALPNGGAEPAKLDPTDIPVNSIVRRNDGVSWVVDGSRVRHHIPYAQDDVCWRNLRGYTVSATGLTYAQASAVGTEADAWPCIIGERVVRSNDGSSWRVDTNNARHWIPDTDTYGFWAARIPVVGPWPAGDVNQIPRGSDEPYRYEIGNVANTIICRNDGVCWTVDGGNVRHHIPTFADNVCWRWVNGWRVSRNGLTFNQANSLPEGEARGCSLNNRIIATNEGASYYMEGNTRRWIQDVESFYCYADNRGAPVIRGMGMDEARNIPEGGWMPQCLSRARVRNHIVRASDGTAYFVDGGSWWHWIPNGTVWYCLTSRYSTYLYSASWTQINSIRQENGWANCGM